MNDNDLAELCGYLTLFSRLDVKSNAKQMVEQFDAIRMGWTI